MKECSPLKEMTMLDTFLSLLMRNPAFLFDAGSLFLMLALLFTFEQSVIPAVVSGILGVLLIAGAYSVDRRKTQALDNILRWIEEQRNRKR